MEREKIKEILFEKFCQLMDWAEKYPVVTPIIVSVISSAITAFIITLILRKQLWCK